MPSPETAYSTRRGPAWCEDAVRYLERWQRPVPARVVLRAARHDAKPHETIDGYLAWLTLYDPRLYEETADDGTLLIGLDDGR